MTLSNVKLILAREIRDQMRDRRTLFMILVLPILLYPLLGISFFQLTQFLREQPTKVLIVDAQNLDDIPSLFDNQQFAAELFDDPDRARLLELHFPPLESPENNSRQTDLGEFARQQVQAGQYDAALYFPPDFAERLDHFRQAIAQRKENRKENKNAAELNVALSVPNPEIIYTTASEKSQIAFARLSQVLRNWTERISEENLEAGGLTTEALRPFTLESADLARESGYRQSASWAKILPVLLILWALTGAFYPAIDLCAGEKERNTLETLLSSPAQRSEIVLGKLLAIMLFSVITAILNILSVGITVWAVFFQLGLIQLPPLISLLWLFMALLPVSALFSALCLAIAAFARSTKEGQYYLMPLLLITMPLVILPMSPGVELNLGNSLIPITGIVVLLRSLLEGHYLSAIKYTPVVAAVTLASCTLAIRWAVDQFNSDTVLFRESERLDLRLWLRRLLSERYATPTVAGAIFCAIVVLMARFFVSFSLHQPSDFAAFARMALITQLAVILTPALLMTLVLTGNPRETLLLKMPAWKTIPAALLLAVLLHPAANVLQVAFTQLYPVSESTKKALENIQQMLLQANIWQLLLVIAVVPAICEELTFRGFMLSGFRHIGFKWRAIVLSAFFFGITHGILQQSLMACFAGVVLGYLAVQTGSILPCMIFHVTHNSLAVLNSRLTPTIAENFPWFSGLMIHGKDGAYTYPWSVVTITALMGLLILLWLGRLPYRKTPEEELQESIKRGETLDAKPKEISVGLASLLK